MKFFKNKTRKIKNNRIKSVSLLTFILISLYFINLSLKTPFAQEATESTVTNQEVKENIKERLEKVIKETDTTQRIKKAWIGNLESIANNTLTIGTKEGPKLASISAETTFVRLPKRLAIKSEDLEINAFTIAIGLLNGNQVLEALRVIIDEEPPAKTTRKSNFVIIDDFSQKDELLTVHTLPGDSYTLEITKDTTIHHNLEGEMEELTTDDLQPQRKAVIITELTENQDKQNMILLKIHLLPLQ